MALDEATLEQLIDTVRRFVADHMPAELVRQCDASHSFPREVFDELSVRENLLMGAYTRSDSRETSNDFDRAIRKTTR